VRCPFGEARKTAGDGVATNGEEEEATAAAVKNPCADAPIPARAEEAADCYDPERREGVARY
jgi:hypothetical protein